MKFTLPDWLSLSRIPLAILFFIFIHEAILSFILLVVIIITDVLDGFLARKLNQVTKYGGALDPLTDKFFIVGAFIAYTVIEKIFVWEFILLIIRDIYSVTEMIVIAAAKHAKKHKASVFGKVTTTLQFITIGVLIFEISWLFIPVFVALILFSLITVYTYAKHRWFD